MQQYTHDKELQQYIRARITRSSTAARTSDGGVGKGLLLCCSGDDVLLHSSGHVEAQHEHGPRLAEAVRARLRLRVDLGVPVSVKEDDSVRGLQVEAHAARAQAEQHDGDLRAAEHSFSRGGPPVAVKAQ